MSIEEKLTESTKYMETLYNDKRKITHGIALLDGLDITRTDR